MIARLWLIMMSAAVAAVITLAQAQNSEFEALPKAVAPAPPPAPAVTEKPEQKQKSAAEIAAERKAAAEKLAAEKRAAAEKAAAEKAAEKKATAKDAIKEKATAATEKEPPAQKKGAALNAKEKEEDIQLGRRMAPSAAIPPFPGDEKGPKTIDFLGSCASEYDRCMETVRDIGEKLPATELCVPPELYFNTVTDRVRKWATLRPDIHGLPAGRVIAAALRSIYPCKQTPPSRTAAEKAAKAAKEAQ
jgi:hypothetical protein